MSRTWLLALCLAVLRTCSAANSTNATGTTTPAADSTSITSQHVKAAQGAAANATADPMLDPLKLPDCSDMPISVRQLDLAARADIVLTGITLAAGPGAGRCDNKTGALNIALDNSTDVSTNFIVLGVQCVHKGLLSCRNNEEDTKDCLILIAAPSMKDATPCSLSQGERYQVYLQKQTNGCGGYYLTMYERIFHSVRRPLGGTGCTFYPSFPDPTDLKTQLAATCTKPTTCQEDMCSPKISKSPCANDTSVSCTMKTCPGKWMYQNAIMPADTCYELYNYGTSGLPTNCYGRRYVNNRIRELARNDLLTNGTRNGTMPGDDGDGADGAHEGPFASGTGPAAGGAGAATTGSTSQPAGGAGTADFSGPASGGDGKGDGAAAAASGSGTKTGIGALAERLSGALKQEGGV